MKLFKDYIEKYNAIKPSEEDNSGKEDAAGDKDNVAE